MTRIEPSLLSGKEIKNIPAGNITAITVQTAINKLDTKKVAKTGDTMTGTLVTPGVRSSSNMLIGGSGVGALTLDSIRVGSTRYVEINTTSKVFFPVQAPTVTAPTYVLGGIYFDTTLNKLRVGGAVGWETVTST